MTFAKRCAGLSSPRAHPRALMTEPTIASQPIVFGSKFQGAFGAKGRAEFPLPPGEGEGEGV